MARTPTRNERVAELEKLLQRPRNHRKINFGKNQASIEFRSVPGSDSSKDNALILSGTVAVAGQLGPLYVSNMVTLQGTAPEKNLIVGTLKDSRGLQIPNEELNTGGQGLSIKSDNTLFGEGGDDQGRLALGAGEDLKLYHNGTDSFIKNSTGKLTLSSPKGTSTKIDFTTVPGGVAAGEAVLTFDLNQAAGEQIKIGIFDNDIEAGHLVMLHENKWYKVNPNDQDGSQNSTDTLLAIALENYINDTTGALVLLRGIIRLRDLFQPVDQNGIEHIGNTIWIDNIVGQYTFDPPTTGQVKRSIGYVLDSNYQAATISGDYLIYFKPSNEWVVVA